MYVERDFAMLGYCFVDFFLTSFVAVVVFYHMNDSKSMYYMYEEHNFFKFFSLLIDLDACFLIAIITFSGWIDITADPLFLNIANIALYGGSTIVAITANILPFFKEICRYYGYKLLFIYAVIILVMCFIEMIYWLIEGVIA